MSRDAPSPSKVLAAQEGGLREPLSPQLAKVTRKQLQQALTDKAVLVKALHKLTNELAEVRVRAGRVGSDRRAQPRPIQHVRHYVLWPTTCAMSGPCVMGGGTLPSWQARAESRRHAEASQRTLEAAWRLGELGQIGLGLLNEVSPEKRSRDRMAEEID